MRDHLGGDNLEGGAANLRVTLGLQKTGKADGENQLSIPNHDTAISING